MASLVTYEEIENASPRSVSVSATETQLAPSRLGQPRRKSFFIVPLTAAVTVTVTKGDAAAVAGEGYVLEKGQPMVEADGPNFDCYQGQLRVVATGNGSVAIVEVFDV